MSGSSAEAASAPASSAAAAASAPPSADPAPPAPTGLYPLPSLLRLKGEVVHGFKRGSKELGVPTANLPLEALGSVIDDFPAGIYFGWASVGASATTYKMVMSIGW